MYVRVLSVLVFSCVGSGLTTGRSFVHGALPTVSTIHTFKSILNEKRPQGLIQQEEKNSDKFERKEWWSILVKYPSLCLCRRESMNAIT
jgi:hypothetical protein